MIYLNKIWKYSEVVESSSVGLVNSSHHPLTVEWPPASRARIRSTDRWPFSHVPINLTNFIHSWNHIPFLSPSTLSSFFNVSTDFSLPRHIYQAHSSLAKCLLLPDLTGMSTAGSMPLTGVHMNLTIIGIVVFLPWWRDEFIIMRMVKMIVSP